MQAGDRPPVFDEFPGGRGENGDDQGGGEELDWAGGAHFEEGISLGGGMEPVKSARE